ncbi:MAG: hypothetical protein Roseis2KO_35910 [Roseivirga sp.]
MRGSQFSPIPSHFIRLTDIRFNQENNEVSFNYRDYVNEGGSVTLSRSKFDLAMQNIWVLRKGSND